MPRGAAILVYEGKRGRTFRVKYRDAAGRQVMETLGREPEWSRERAERELGKRLDRVEKGHRRPRRLTFAAFADTFETEYLPGRNLKRSTLVDYGSTLRCHLLPFFDGMELAAIGPREIDAYITAKTNQRKPLSPKTVGNHLRLLNVMFKVAARWQLVTANPVALVERPRVEQPEMNVLSEAEVAALAGAYRELELAADESERPWWRLARRLVLVALGTALRRGELLALRWRDVNLLEGRLTVREAYVAGRFTTPKSRSSRRTMELGPRTRAVLEEQWRESPYQGDGELVFCHPTKGTPLDASKLSRDYLRSALTKAKIEKPFRPWHDLRHTALTHEAAAGNPAVYVQLRAGHSQGTVTERYVHASQVLFPGAAEKGENRLFGALSKE